MPTVPVASSSAAAASGLNPGSSSGGGTGYPAGVVPVLFPDNIVSPVDPHLYCSLGGAVTMANGAIRGARVLCTAAGTLTDLAVCIGTSSGNISAAVYDVTGTPRNRLFTTGAIACPASGWAIVGSGSLGISVTAGQQLEFAVTADNAVVTLNGLVGTVASQVFPAPYWNNGGVAKAIIVWANGAGNHPAPATLAEASMGTTTTIVPVIARIV